MFGKKKTEATSSGSKSIMPTSTSNSLNSLVKGTKIEGTVVSESDIRIDGIIKGSLTCKAKVIIGPSGVVEGDVKCDNAVIEGRFEGNLSVAQLLIVKETAQLHGDVVTQKLQVQPGAIFDVTCRMGSGNNISSNGSSNVRKAIKGNQSTKIGKKVVEQTN